MKAKNNNTIQTLAYEIYYCETETFKTQRRTSKTSENKKKTQSLFDVFFDALSDDIFDMHFDVYFDAFFDVIFDVYIDVIFNVYTDAVFTVGK